MGILASSCRTPPELVHDDMPRNNALPMDTPGLDGKAALIKTFRAQISKQMASEDCEQKGAHLDNRVASTAAYCRVHNKA